MENEQKMKSDNNRGEKIFQNEGSLIMTVL